MCVLWNKSNEYVCDILMLTFPIYIYGKVPEMNKPSSVNVVLKYCFLARCGGLCLKSQHFGRPRWVDHLRSGV